MYEWTNTTPVLLLVFCRPDTTLRVFEAIRQAKPTRLYVAADGPRPNPPAERERTEMVRSLVLDGVDWDCEVKTRFRSQNLGCRVAVSQAISWFFEHESEGIILEDDTLPDPTFFRFCQELLEQYRHDTRIIQVCGYNLVASQVESSTSYYPSHFGSCWGWASWARAWKFYDVTMGLWASVRDSYVTETYPFTPLRNEQFEDNCGDDSTTWDVQWSFAQSVHSGLLLVPAVNLVRNIGFGTESDARIAPTLTCRKRAWHPNPWGFPSSTRSSSFPTENMKRPCSKLWNPPRLGLRKILPSPVFRALKRWRNEVRNRLRTWRTDFRQ